MNKVSLPLLQSLAENFSEPSSTGDSPRPMGTFQKYFGQSYLRKTGVAHGLTAMHSLTDDIGAAAYVEEGTDKVAAIFDGQ